MRSGQLRRGKPLRSKPRKRHEEGPLSPKEWYWAVVRKSGFRDVVTGEKVEDVADLEAHHVVEKGILRQRRLYDHVWDPRNGIALKVRTHERHTTAFQRVPYEALPPEAFEFARELGEWALVEIERKYPRSEEDR